jgi:hypothetical protein
MVASPTPAASAIVPQMQAPTGSAQFGTYQGLIADTMVESILLRNGYVVQENIMIRDPKDHDQVGLRRARNKYGDVVMILIDRDQVYISPTGKDITLIEKKEVEVVPVSTTMSAYDCVQNEVCGVAMECENGICTAVRDNNNMQPMVTTLEFVTPHAEQSIAQKSVVLDSHVIAYPIVRLSEIEADPKGTMKASHEASLYLRAKAYKESVLNTQEAFQSLEMFEKQYEQQIRFNERYAELLNQDMAKLESFRVQYEAKSQLVDADRQKYEGVHRNERRRLDMEINLIKANYDLAAIKATIDAGLAALKDLSERVAQDAKLIGGNIID